MRRERIVPIVLFAVILLVPIVAKLAGQPYWITIANKIVIFSIAVVSLDLVLGYAGLPSFGHAAFFGLGGFTVAILAQQTRGGWAQLLGAEALISWSVAVLVAGIAGAIIGALALRTRGVHFLMITLAFSQMVYYVFVGLPSYGGDEGLRMNARQKLLGLDLADPMAFYYVSAAVLIGVALLVRMIVGSHFGRTLVGCRQNERRMRFLGYRTDRYLLVAFVISAACTGLAGALMVNLQRYVSPHSLSWFQSGEFMVMNTLGGLASTWGGIVGTGAFVLLHEALVSRTEHWEVFLGICVLALVLVSPSGMMGWRKALRLGHD